MTASKGHLSRRAILKLSLALSGLLGLGGIARFLSYREPSAANRVFSLGPPEGYDVGSVTPFPHARAWLVRDADGFYAMSSMCTHLGCAVAHEAEAFACPCHGSRFTLEGMVLKGPALRPLDHLELTLSPDNQLVLDTSVQVPSITRLSLAPRDQPTA
jgi:cytochrome b6-f complex iron-sulfur subunit